MIKFQVILVLFKRIGISFKKNVSFLKNPSKITKFKLKLKLCESDKLIDIMN